MKILDIVGVIGISLLAAGIGLAITGVDIGAPMVGSGVVLFGLWIIFGRGH